jgi:hypothetical protein
MGAGLDLIGLVTSAGKQMSCVVGLCRLAAGIPPPPLPGPLPPNPRHPRTEILFYIGNRK